MRMSLILAALLSAAAPVHAQAQPSPAAYARDDVAAQPQVVVSIAPAFAEKGRRIGIGQQDFQELQKDLYGSTVRALRKAGGAGPVRADLVILDAVPNRPTFDQYGRNVSLSARSVGLGGASVSGTVFFADGRSVPVRYRWYETDLRDSFANATWTDADRAFEQLGRTLQRGDLQAHGWGEASPNGGAFGSRFGDGSRW